MTHPTLEDLLRIEPLRVCSGCRKELPITDFHRNKLQRNGRHTWCKWCREVSRKMFAAANPERVKASQRRRARKWRYGITDAEYEARKAEQTGACAICLEVPNPDIHPGQLLVDHDHATGLIRGLLCRNCNLALGYLRDDPALLERAIAYLKGGD